VVAVGVVTWKALSVPILDLALAGACGLLAVAASVRATPDLTGLVKFTRPAMEGYATAAILFGLFRIRTMKALVMVLAGYVLIQGFLSGLMLALPDLRTNWLDHWYSDDSYQDANVVGALLFRGYGVSRHHLFGLPLAVGTVSAMLVVFGRLCRGNRMGVYASLTGLCGLAIVLLNARIGVFPLMICYLLGLSVCFDRHYLRQLLTWFPIFAIALLLVTRALMGDAFDFFANWLLEGVRLFSSADTAGTATTIDDLKEMAILPTSLTAWLVGLGRVCQWGEDCYTDIGWIRLLQQGGVLLAVLVAVLYMRASWRALRMPFSIEAPHRLEEEGSSHRLLLGILVSTFLAATIKGEAFGANEYSRLMMLLGTFAHMSIAELTNEDPAVALDPTTGSPCD
jgi:hypothetical protein